LGFSGYRFSGVSRIELRSLNGTLDAKTKIAEGAFSRGRLLKNIVLAALGGMSGSVMGCGAVELISEA